MKDFNIYRNNEVKLTSGFSSDYEKLLRETGSTTVNGLLVTLIGKETSLAKKIMNGQNFILDKSEKKTISEVLEKHIDPKLNGFRNANEDDPYSKVIYKGKTYRSNTKGLDFQSERDLVRAMSLYNKFFDPNDEDIIEIRYS